MRHKTRMTSIGRAGAKARSVTARTVGDLTFKNDDLYVDGVVLPNTPVAPRGVIQTAIEVVNGAYLITPLDPDSCTSGIYNGYKYILSVDPEWGDEQSVENCLPINQLGMSNEVHGFQIGAPTEPGVYAITYTIELPGSGAVASETRSVVIEEGGQQIGGGDSDDEENGGGSGGVVGAISDIINAGVNNPEISGFLVILFLIGYLTR